MRDAVPVHSTATARSSHQDHRLSDRHHQGSMPGRTHRKHDLPESLTISAAGFPVDEQTGRSLIQLDQLSHGSFE